MVILILQAQRCEGTAKYESKFCFSQGKPVPASTMNTYDQYHEALFYACENSVGAYGEDMVEYIADALEDQRNITNVAYQACHKIGRCMGRKPQADRASQDEL